MTPFLLIVFLFNTQWTPVSSLNILGVFPYEGKTHFFVFEKYLQALAGRGHNLTVISHFPRKQPLDNYHDVSLSGGALAVEGNIPMERSYASILGLMDLITTAGTRNCKQLIENKKVQKLLESQMKFDLVVMQMFNTDCAVAIAHKLEAPVIGVTTTELMPWHYSNFGIPYNPSYVPELTSGGYKPHLYQRLEKLFLHIMYNIKFQSAQKVDEEILAGYFKDLPPLAELRKDIKLMLVYQNFVLMGSRLLPANVIEVAGYHVAPPGSLPQDIQKFIDDSEHGVIYVSFGSMLRASSLPPHKMAAILDTLAELPQRVIWKWNEATFPGDTKDIYLSNWLPQNAILAHPKILAFYSHGGLLSTTEAIYRSVPLVAMPVFGDQPVNAAAAEQSGFGVQISLSELTKENLLAKFRTVLNPAFRDRVKLLSRAFRDRPVTPVDSAVFWTEFAAKYHNVTSRNLSVDVPLYQYLCLDIIAVLLTALVLALVVIVKMVSFLLTVPGYVRVSVSLSKVWKFKNKRD